MSPNTEGHSKPVVEAWNPASIPLGRPRTSSGPTSLSPERIGKIKESNGINLSRSMDGSPFTQRRKDSSSKKPLFSITNGNGNNSSNRKLYTFKEHKLHRIPWDHIQSVIQNQPSSSCIGHPYQGFCLELGSSLGRRNSIALAALNKRSMSNNNNDNNGSIESFEYYEEFEEVNPYGLEDTERYEYYFKEHFYNKGQLS
jgi:hypothetical protein